MSKRPIYATNRHPHPDKVEREYLDAAVQGFKALHESIVRDILNQSLRPLNTYTVRYPDVRRFAHAAYTHVAEVTQELLGAYPDEDLPPQILRYLYGTSPVPSPQDWPVQGVSVEDLLAPGVDLAAILTRPSATRRTDAAPRKSRASKRPLAPPPPPPRAILEAWIQENLMRLRDISEKHARFLATSITYYQELGGTPDEKGLAAMAKAYGINVNRIRLIVTDQLGKLRAKINAHNAQELGIEEFTWVSQRDDKVRPSHVAADGKIYTYKQGHPTEGLPGEPPRCRCYDVPRPPRK